MSTLAENVRMLHMTMDTFAHAKRFNERWLADPAFRGVLFRDPVQAVQQYELPVDTEEARGMVRGDAEQAGSLARGVHAITAAKSAVMKEWYGPDAVVADERVAAWRSRRQARMLLELGPFPAKSSIRAAWTAELTRGCSGGCWFCNMAAPELSGIAPSDEAALEEWREIVRLLQRTLGPAIRTGFLDGASDPFDHPDYEAFARIVDDEAGFYPPTSTALALSDPDRSRRFFAAARERGCWSIRLTVRDREEFDALHTTFSSQELANVQLNVMTPESSFIYSLAGRYRERYLNDPKFAAREHRKLAFAPWFTGDEAYFDETAYPFDANTGVIGFSLNMVDRDLALVAPVPSSDANPLGFETLARESFADIDELSQVTQKMIERLLPTRLCIDDRLMLWDGLTVELLPHGARFHGRFRQFTDITDPDHAKVIQSLTSTLQSEPITVRAFCHSCDFDHQQALSVAQRLFEAGLLAEVQSW